MNSIAIMSIDSLGEVATGAVLSKDSPKDQSFTYLAIASMHPISR